MFQQNLTGLLCRLPLRTYTTLRREQGNEYLGFLQFFLNYRRFLRNVYQERVGKSPTELLTGERHMHWLEMLGLQRFKKPGPPQKAEANSKIDGKNLIKIKPIEEPRVEKIKPAA